MDRTESESFNLPAVGELRARPGTATHELAGGMKYWHDKAKTARLDGIVAGGSLVVFAELVCYAAYYLIRSLF